MIKVKYGYVRVSTKEQNIDRQMSALIEANLSIENIFIDKASGKNFERESYKKMVKKLKKGDEIYIKSIDRLGRNYDEIINEWNYFTKEVKVDIIVLDFPLLDTREKDDNLTGKFISDIVLQILSYVAQIERENTLQRQKEGIYEAMKKGVKFGRPSIEIPDEFYSLAQSWDRGEISLREGAKIMNVSHSTFNNWIKNRR